MSQDEIIQEVWTVREAYAEKFGFDVDALFRDAKSRERRSGRKVVALPAKKARAVAPSPAQRA